MKSIYTIQRPSLPLTPACAPSAAMPIITAGARAPLSQVHQVQIQAELARVRVIGDSSNGTAGLAVSKGFVGSTDVAVKVAVGGVPPRGRPV
ncbi:MAG TPA: hypothetical protein VFR35_20410 [Actinoplanes sp.]|nr:hypothetical protein [Actinoplanes sp.]